MLQIIFAKMFLNISMNLVEKCRCPWGTHSHLDCFSPEVRWESLVMTPGTLWVCAAPILAERCRSVETLHQPPARPDLLHTALRSLQATMSHTNRNIWQYSTWPCIHQNNRPFWISPSSLHQDYPSAAWNACEKKMNELIRALWEKLNGVEFQRVSLEHHFSDSGGDGFSRAVVPDEFGILVCSFKDVHSGLWVIPHGVHENGWQEPHQGQTDLFGGRDALL